MRPRASPPKARRCSSPRVHSTHQYRRHHADIVHVVYTRIILTVKALQALVGEEEGYGVLGPSGRRGPAATALSHVSLRMAIPTLQGDTEVEKVAKMNLEPTRHVEWKLAVRIQALRRDGKCQHSDPHGD